MGENIWETLMGESVFRLEAVSVPVPGDAIKQDQMTIELWAVNFIWSLNNTPIYMAVLVDFSVVKPSCAVVLWTCWRGWDGTFG